MVLLHGNVVTAEDWVLSGVLDQVAAQGHRVIAFDRPGYGYSDRPRGTAWTAAAQADLLRRALARLGVERPVVVGHSWGTLAALALALADPAAVRGLVLVSGYYNPTLRADALLVAPAAVPVLGDVLRHTVSPLFGAASLPLLVKGMFAPLPVPERFQQGFEHGMAVRPSQISAEAEDGAAMAHEVAAMRDRYGELHMPVVIMAGSEDQVVDVGRHAVRLREQIPHGELRLVPGAGHMVHHAVPEQVAEVIEAVASGHRLPGGPELEGTRLPVRTTARRWRQSDLGPGPWRAAITSSTVSIVSGSSWAAELGPFEEACCKAAEVNGPSAVLPVMVQRQAEEFGRKRSTARREHAASWPARS